MLGENESETWTKLFCFAIKQWGRVSSKSEIKNKNKKKKNTTRYWETIEKEYLYKCVYFLPSWRSRLCFLCFLGPIICCWGHSLTAY